MQKAYYLSLIFLPGLIISGIYKPVQAESLVQVTDHPISLIEQDTFSPRRFCQNTGGTVTETNSQHIYLCCYEVKNKCIATDTRASVSRILPFR